MVSVWLTVNEECTILAKKFHHSLFFTLMANVYLKYSIYSNKRRTWDKKVNKRRTPNAALIRGIPYTTKQF